MTTLLFTHEACLNHDPGRMHPEHPARLKSVLAALSDPEFDALERREAPSATLEQIARVHPETMVRRILAAVPPHGLAAIDADTVMSPGTGEAVLRATGAAVAAVDAVLAGEARNAFCAVRPPGHHAEPMRAMGFCFFNSVAVAAAHARAVHGLARVAIVDFDVHHGNGTQAAFAATGGVFYASTHQMPLYPGTGARGERGVGNILNVPLHPMAGSEEFRQAYSEVILPALVNFDPDLLMISAGFDAHVDDPLASIALVTEDFAWITRELLRVADRVCDGKVVSCLEGGYDLQALGDGCAAHVRALLAA
ncbi:histone deacetylase superfamily protein [alpha proteobacterium BAL199]|jgi:acetoin utilization deacetylase AcuC-like enzyme|nr:histone deacetylase superfamily protein [alpha proteobacterium BAL199]